MSAYLLVLAYLLVREFALAQTAQPLCDAGPLDMTTVVTPLAQSYVGTGCVLNRLVNVSAVGIPTLSSAGLGSVTTILITASLITSASCLQLLAPSLETSPNLVPFQATIKGNTFEPDGAFRFQGSLPPNSWLIFEQNDMIAHARNEYTGMLGSWTNLVGFTSQYVIHLFEHSAITVRNNSFTSHSGPVTLSQTLLMFSSMILHKGSSVNVAGNSFLANETELVTFETIAIHFVFPNNILDTEPARITYVGEDTAFIFEDNTFELVTYSNAGLLIAMPTTFGTNFSSPSRTLFAFRNNDINLVTDIEIEYPSFYIVEGISVNEVQIVGNKYSVTNNAYGVILAITILPGGRFLMADNHYEHTLRPFTQSYFLTASFDLQGDAELIVEGNKMVAPSYTTTAVYFLMGMALSTNTPDPLPCAYFCQNSMPWAPEANGSEVYSPLLADRSDERCDAVKASTVTATHEPPKSSTILGMPSATQALQRSLSHTLAAYESPIVAAGSVTPTNIDPRTISGSSLQLSRTLSDAAVEESTPTPTIADQLSGSMLNHHSPTLLGKSFTHQQREVPLFTRSRSMSKTGITKTTPIQRLTSNTVMPDSGVGVPTRTVTASQSTDGPPDSGGGNAPPNIVNNAEEDPVVSLALAAAAEQIELDAAVSSTLTCRRLERLLVESALLFPLPLAGASTYGDALLGALAMAALVLALGATNVCIATITGKVANINESAARIQADHVTLPATTMRFPATAIQCFCFLSHGAAVAAGLSLGIDGVSAGPILALIVLAASPVAWCVLVRLRCDGPRIVSLASEETEDVAMHNDSPTTTSRPKSRRLLLCGVVEPRDHAKQLGPLVGDLRIQNLLSPAIPSALPLCLFVASLVAGLAAPCELVPLVAGCVMAVYSLVIVFSRPFLAITHNAVEVAVSVSAAACLVVWSTGFKDTITGTSAAEDITSAPAVLYLLVALSSCRYPFVLARALDVVLPAIMKISAPSKTVADKDNSQIEDPLLVHEKESTGSMPREALATASIDVADTIPEL